MLLYKYRSIENFQNFVDIILNKRLYAARYLDLNDPMEGHYIYVNGGVHNNDIVNAIKGEKESLRIVSLSRNPSSTLMWSHYANGHRGVLVGVEVNENKYDIQRVNYSDSLFNLEYNYSNQGSSLAEHILSQKQSAWSYEDEERIFVRNGREYAEVEVKEVVLGSKMSTRNRGFIKKLISKIDPNIIVSTSNSQSIYFSA